MLEFLKENVDITGFSNFKTKASTKYFFEIKTIRDVEKLAKIYEFVNKENLGLLFIGGGTNLLFAFDNYNGVVIKNSLFGWSYDIDKKLLKSYSNEAISDISESLEKDYNQNIWHRFIGLPGTIGGAIFGNAGCFGLETENNFKEAYVFDFNKNTFLTLSKKEMNFAYRNSLIKEKFSYFLIYGIFDLSKKNEKYSSDVDNIDFRKNKQPSGNTCGSFFKNPSRQNSAGKLIEEVGLKGYKLGGAYFSKKHANFLMNDGGSYKDLLDLINLAELKVKEKFGISLVNEVRIIKNN